MSEWLVSWQANGKAWVTLEIKAKQHKMHKPNQSVQNFKADVMRKMNIFEHFELVRVLVAQLYSTLCDPIDCSPPGSSVLRILQARI